MGVDDNNLVLHEDHFDVNVEVFEKGNVGLEMVGQSSGGTVLGKFKENAFSSRDMSDDSTPELGFVDAPPAIRITPGRLTQTCFIQFTGCLHMLDLTLFRQWWQVFIKYVLTLFHIIV
jgi:hypothetical protein